jgi:hypothetical protein
LWALKVNQDNFPEIKFHTTSEFKGWVFDNNSPLFLSISPDSGK